MTIFFVGWLIFLAVLSLILSCDSQWHKDGLEEVRCPTYIGNAPCDCVAASDGLDFTCGSEKTRLADIRSVVSAARFPIKTLAALTTDRMSASRVLFDPKVKSRPSEAAMQSHGALPM